jgi:hypothetical protein
LNRSLCEPDALNCVGSVQAITRQCALCFRQNPQALVVTDGVRTDAR